MYPWRSEGDIRALELEVQVVVSHHVEVSSSAKPQMCLLLSQRSCPITSESHHNAAMRSGVCVHVITALSYQPMSGTAGTSGLLMVDHVGRCWAALKAAGPSDVPVCARFFQNSSVNRNSAAIVLPSPFRQDNEGKEGTWLLRRHQPKWWVQEAREQWAERRNVLAKALSCSS